MIRNYSVTGDERKRMVRVICEATGEDAMYTRLPECAYVIGTFKVSKTGELSWDAAEEDTLAKVTAALVAAGFMAEDSVEENTHDGSADADIPEAGDGQNADKEYAPAGEPDSLSFAFPRADFTDMALNNLRNLVASKAALIKKALQADRLDIEVTDDRITFPWWDHMPTQGEIMAYGEFLAAVVKMAKEAKRVTAKEHPVESEKYTFRVFLLRLGFIGPEHKETRSILMKPLSGYAAFKNKADADAFYARLKEKRAAQATTEATVNRDSDGVADQGGRTEPNPTAPEAVTNTDIATAGNDLENAEEATDEIPG